VVEDEGVEISNLGYRTDLMLLRLAGSEVTDRGEYVVVRTPANPTFWWGNFLLFRADFGRGELAGRLDLFHAELPDARHVALGIDSTDGTVLAEEELAAAGLSLERNTVMTASQVRPPARPNTAAAYRPVTSDDDWARLLELTLVCSPSDTPGYVEFTRRRMSAERGLTEAGWATWFGAFDGDRLQASLGLVSDGSGVARFQNVQTHPDDRGQGLASSLVHRASTYGFDELGAHTLVMVADPGYLAIRIYRLLGFADTQTQVQLTKPSEQPAHP
jgi:ribosomal protein S18 acetylase RimI-like enzyme